ncbi:MAG TPA: beta-hexosaminidase, partial [Alphaproteobacteria bacterium]|nr:beta-hexosaminidase [Alphaproteobacteria bacterium]
MIAPIIVGLGSLGLSLAEKQLLKHFRPAGFIIFGRNIDEPKQVRHLISSICQFYGSRKFLFLIDQEGGRVCRLKPPHRRLPPPA